MAAPKTWLMGLSLLLGASLLSAADKPVEEAVKKEMAKLEGTWELKVTEGATQLRLVFASGKLTVVWPGDGSLPAAVKIYPDTDPKCIDIEFKKVRQEHYEGIYEIKGDTLKLNLAPPSVKDRPTKFPEGAGAGNGHLFGVFKRKKG